jgi:hypothetical protein
MANANNKKRFLIEFSGLERKNSARRGYRDINETERCGQRLAESDEEGPVGAFGHARDKRRPAMTWNKHLLLRTKVEQRRERG